MLSHKSSLVFHWCLYNKTELLITLPGPEKRGEEGFRKEGEMTKQIREKPTEKGRSEKASYSFF